MAGETCQQLTQIASNGVAPALRAVDCVANEMAGGSFARLLESFGPVLTILLTLYIAFFGFMLITGRASLGLSSLVTRMLTIGLVVTFATSWIAYQGAAWNLAIAGPDWVASRLTGERGSATQIFADKIDIVFGVVNEIGENADATGKADNGDGSDKQGSKERSGTAGAKSIMSPQGVMWMGAILLLLGTVGILLTARIALGILLALGPIFVIMALFKGTRGLTVGWLRGLVMTALTPLFVVLGGSIILELLVPIVNGLVQSSQLGEIDGRSAMAFFTVAAVHVALMVMVFKVAGMMVSGWTVFGLAPASEQPLPTAVPPAAPAGSGQPMFAVPQMPAASRAAQMRTATVNPAVAGAIAGQGTGAGGGGAGASGERRTVITQVSGGGIAPAGHGQDARARGIGSRFRSASNDTGRKPVKEKK